MRYLLLPIMLLALSPALAQDYAVVVASTSTIDSLDGAQLKGIFLRQRSFEGDVRLVPVNLLGEESMRIEFEERVLMMNRDEINRYWITNHFQGVRPPATQASLQSVKAFVQRVEGAIGYLPRNMVDAEVKVVYEF
jgi:ABC-type phosphate transport system substrate-binding protein